MPIMPSREGVVAPVTVRGGDQVRPRLGEERERPFWS